MWLHARRRALILAMACLAWTGPAPAEEEVGITATIQSVQVLHQGRPVRIERNPDTFNMIDPDYALTSRPCPPFCIQPMHLAPGVETIAELEVLDYLQQASRGGSITLVDSRDGDWPRRSGIIPGAVSIPWQELHPAHTDPERIADTLVLRFGAARVGNVWNFENARTLVLYCNGSWCGQSPTNIKQLLSMGYPAHKLKWYRGGMQDWKGLGLTTVAPD
ncbi:MAG TPA: rhodanese-like domain-containing protein [Thiobacillaceae bacterium]|nr:rhodanese-like domain-containing protein [Thiobacillaceae bacterium]HNU64888.1 rhodanese-like domain-containing protein [Thiobacillaceae bacterium]